MILISGSWVSSIIRKLSNVFSRLFLNLRGKYSMSKIVCPLCFFTYCVVAKVLKNVQIFDIILLMIYYYEKKLVVF